MNKARVILYFVIVSILLYLSIGYCYELCHFDSGLITDSDFIVDGTNFTPLITLLGYGMEGMLVFFLAIIYTIVIMVANVVLVVPFYLIGLRKSNIMTTGEYKVYWYSYIALLAISLMTCVILTRFTEIAFILIYNAIWAAFVYLLIILPAKKMCQKETV